MLMDHTRPPHVVGEDFDRHAFRVARHEAGMSLVDIAHHSDVSYSELKKLSSGQRRYPRRVTYRRIIAALGLPRGALLLDTTQATHDAHTGGGV